MATDLWRAHKDQHSIHTLMYVPRATGFCIVALAGHWGTPLCPPPQEGPEMRESLREERTLWVTDQIAQDKFPEDLEGFYLLKNPPAEEKPAAEDEGGGGGKKGKVGRGGGGGGFRDCCL